MAGAPFPVELLYLWKIYNRLRRRQGSSGFGSLPVGWPDIDAFTRHSKINLAPWEIEVIEQIDDLFLTVQNKSRKPAK